MLSYRRETQWRHYGGWHPERQLRVSLLYFFLKKNFATFFAHQSSLSLFIDFTRVSPLEGVTQHLFLPVRPRFSTILCKFAHKNFFFRWHPLEDVTRGGPPPPPCDATRELQNTLQDAFVLARPNVADWTERQYFMDTVGLYSTIVI